jgi:hypothetical protein
MASSIPRADGEFHQRLITLVKWLEDNMEEKGYDVAWIRSVLFPTFKEWNTAYGNYVDKSTRTKILTAIKREVRKKMEKAYSEIVRMVKANVKTTDAERLFLNIVPVAVSYHKRIPVTSTAPHLEFVTALAGRLTIEYWELESDSKAMPRGAGAFEFWYKIMDHAPVSISELTNVLIDFQSPLVIDFDASERGKTVYCVARWISPTGEKGPWTVVLMVIVP